MTEAAAGGGTESTVDETGMAQGVYSKDYWDLVFEQLGRRKLFKAGLAILAFLYGVAIFAPLIANDRPYVLEAIDYKGYRSAVSSLYAVTSSVARLSATTPQAYAEARGENAPPALADALAVERSAARDRLDTMRAYLPEGQREPIDEFRAKLEGAIDASLAGDPERAAALGEEAKVLARSLRKELAPLDPERPDEGGVELVGARSHPLFESISHWEVLFMALWLALVTWPLWNRLVNRVLLHGDRERVRAWRRRKAAAVVAFAGLASVLWAVTVGGEWGPFASAPYKAGLTSGEIHASQPPVFPPFPMGYAETHTEEMFRPPTWTRASELDEEGHYVRGLRRTRPDPVTGVLPPADPVDVRFAEPGRNSPWRHLAGTDELGRDFFVRILWGGRVSLAVGILSSLLLTVIGVVMGALAGYFGGWVDTAVMRLIEVLQSIPAFFLILMAMAFTDPDVVPPIIAIVVVIAMIRWTGVARLVRGEFLRLREQEFVLAARALGFSSRRTIFRHVLPNAMSPVLVSAAFAVAAGILTESAVSYLGFGIQHPGASWGSLVNESKSADHWWVQVFPGSLIFVTVTCYNLVGDAIRDALDPKMKV